MKLKLKEQSCSAYKGNIQLMDSWQHRSPSQEGGGDEAVAAKKDRSTTREKEGNEK
jgi:hypothetical protein